MNKAASSPLSVAEMVKAKFTEGDALEGVRAIVYT